MKLGRLRVIFKLPETIPSLLLDPRLSSWPKDPLAYVEWYKLTPHPGRYHNMYTATPPQTPHLEHLRLVQDIPGEVILLRSIRQTCQLIPLAKDNENWPLDWTSSNVLDRCNSFLVNNWSSKFAYQTIW